MDINVTAVQSGGIEVEVQTVTGASVSLGQSPYIDESTQTWWVFNDATGKYFDTGIPGGKGPKGDDGKSAYEYAVEGGYQGTEADFLEWMQRLINTDIISNVQMVTQEEYDAITGKTSDEWFLVLDKPEVEDAG